MLNIVVLVKQVPNTTQVKIDPITHNLVREGVPSIVNPYDLFAVEEALLLKEEYGCQVTILSMGPPQAAEAVKYALAMGADRGILLSDRAFAGSDTLATSYTLAAAIKKLAPVDLVLCGKQAADGDTAQVPAELAEQLDMACLTYVEKILSVSQERLVAERMMDFANVRSEARLPAVLTLNKGVNNPRFPRLLDMVRAMEIPVGILRANDLALDEKRLSFAGSPTQVVKVFSPERSKNGCLLTGSPAENVTALLRELSARQLISGEEISNE